MRAVRSAVVLIVVLVWTGLPVLGQENRSVRPEIRRLEQALADLQARGLRVIYTSQVVRPDMRVVREPRPGPLRRMLDDLLSPHGLIGRDGPGETVLVVKNPRVRPQRSLSPQPTNARPVDAPGDGAGPPRFEETVEVVDDALGVAAWGTPAVSIHPVQAQGLAGGFENVFRMLQTLPGVVGTDELGSRIAVRGGGPDQNLVLMDGVEIHNPYRLILPSEDLAVVGLASAFNPDTIDSFEFFPGAFDVRYGDRLSSLLLVTNREGSEAKRFQGSSLLSLAEANVVLEGQLPGRSGSWLVSGRRSHLNLVAQPLVDVSLPSFQDVHARMSWRPRPWQRIALVGLAGREATPSGARDGDAGYTTRARNGLVAVTVESAIGLRGSSRTVASFSRLTDGLSAYEQSFDNSRGANTAASIGAGGLLQFQVARDLAVNDLAVRQDFVVKPSNRHWLDVGAEAHRLDTRWSWRIAGDRAQHQANGSSVRLGANLPEALDSSRQVFRFGAWVQDRWRLSQRIVLRPGLRVDRSSLTGQTTLSPRVNGTVGLGGGLRLDAAVGLYTQSPGYEKALQSDYFVDLSQAGGSPLRAEQAVQAVVGLQRRLGRGLTARVDAYHKRFSSLIVGELESDHARLDRLAGYDVPTELRADLPSELQITATPSNAAAGQSHGVEVYAVRTGEDASARLTGWSSYSWGRATRTAYGVTRAADYDRRHALSAVVNVRLGPRVDVSTSARWASGLPRTPVRGVRLALTRDADDSDRDGNRDEWVPQRETSGELLFQPDLGGVTNINTARLPPFGRIDARVAYRPTWGGDRWAFHVDLVNLLNRKNVTQIDSALVFAPAADRPAIIEKAQDRGIPFFPSIGLRVWF